jgi:tetratricopeptide (TPR) repeat protein
VVWSLQFLGLVLTSEGEYELADEAMKEGVALARKLGDLNHSSFSLAFQGDIALQQGNLIKAQSVYEECADLLKGLGNKLFQAYPLRRLGYLALERNEIHQARQLFPPEPVAQYRGRRQACYRRLPDQPGCLGHAPE